MSKFEAIAVEPQDPIYGLQLAIKQDLRKEKANLSIGILINNDGSLKKFHAVQKAEEALFGKESKEYLPIDGLPEFRKEVSSLLLPRSTNSYTTQTVGGTGALFIAGIFLQRFMTQDIFIPDPTWVNHRKLFESCGLRVHCYPYRANKNGSLDLSAVIEAIQHAKEGSAIVLQASCHNPTGIDPTMEEWQQLSLLMLEKKLIPVFDLAYQGLGHGLAEDVLSLELFVRDGHEFFIANSFAKNFGIYSERLGALTIVSRSSIDAISSQIKKIIRTTYSSPPAHGARVVAKILADPELRSGWEQELFEARKEIQAKRSLLYQSLSNSPITLTLAAAVQKSTGLFALLDLTKDKVLELRKQGIYLADDGRINIAAVTPMNAATIAGFLT